MAVGKKVGAQEVLTGEVVTAKSHELLARLSLAVLAVLAAIAISGGFADTTTDRMLLPIEVLGANSTPVSRTAALHAGQAESVRSLWLQIHGLRYADQASVQVNASAWIPLNNNTVTIAEPGRSFGGIGGGFATLVMTLPLPNGTVVGGANTIRFRFNQTDGVVSAYRVLAWNFLTVEGKKLQRQHCGPLPLPRLVRPAGGADRELHSQLATSQSWPPVEPSLPTWTRTRRATGLELGGRRRTRMGPRPGHGRVSVSAWPARRPNENISLKSAGKCSRPP